MFGRLDLEKSMVVFGYFNIFAWLGSTFFSFYLLISYALNRTDVLFHKSKQLSICKNDEISCFQNFKRFSLSVSIYILIGIFFSLLTYVSYWFVRGVKNVSDLLNSFPIFMKNIPPQKDCSKIKPLLIAFVAATLISPILILTLDPLLVFAGLILPIVLGYASVCIYSIFKQMQEN